MSSLFRSISFLLSGQQLDASITTNLVLERLYYADGRHDPRHPLHGRFDGLCVLSPTNGNGLKRSARLVTTTTPAGSRAPEHCKKNC